MDPARPPPVQQMTVPVPPEPRRRINRTALVQILADLKGSIDLTELTRRTGWAPRSRLEASDFLGEHGCLLGRRQTEDGRWVLVAQRKLGDGT